ncbi:hypothetical protein [Candidatus Weimeria sp. HCP3S3_B5]
MSLLTELLNLSLLSDVDKAKEALDHGIELCRRHPDEVPYQR